MLSVEDVTFPNKMLLHSRSQERVLTNKSNIGWKEMTLRIFLEVLDVFIVALRIITFGFIQDKNYRKFKSKKDRFLNPVHLYPELYKDVFVESLHQVNKEEAKNPFVCYMMIGKEALPAFVELLQQSVELNFCNSNSIKLQLDEKVSVIFQNQPFCVGLVKMTIPFITKVCFNDCGNDEAYFLFFETLSKEQRQEKLTIVGLKHVNKLIIE
uniref:Uncharacterized protein n=1 Tax=Panagrolaimus sp. JU765 TaxID=591449 RepID=A0AC34RFC8_9BILA